MLTVDEEDEEYEYDESSDDEQQQQQRKSSVEEDELPLEEEGDKESDRDRKKVRFFSHFLLFGNKLFVFHCSSLYCTCDKSRGFIWRIFQVIGSLRSETRRLLERDGR